MIAASPAENTLLERSILATQSGRSSCRSTAEAFWIAVWLTLPCTIKMVFGQLPIRCRSWALSAGLLIHGAAHAARKIH